MATPKKQNLNFVRGDSNSFNVTIENCLDDLTEIYFTVKETHDDKKPVIQKSLTGGGITHLETVENKEKYNILMSPNDTEQMTPDKEYLYDIELVTVSTRKTILKGTLVLEADITRTKGV